METHLLRNLQFVMESQYCTENGKILGDLDVHIMNYNKRIFMHCIANCRHGWCPYSERVWLAFEVKKVDYDTVYIDNIYGRPR